jgi:hypothetical protein
MKLFSLMIIAMAFLANAENYAVTVSASGIDSLYAFQFRLALPPDASIVGTEAGEVFAGREHFMRASNNNPSLVGGCVLGGVFAQLAGVETRLAIIYIESDVYPTVSISEMIAELQPDSFDRIQMSVSIAVGKNPIPNIERTGIQSRRFHTAPVEIPQRNRLVNALGRRVEFTRVAGAVITDGMNHVVMRAAPR